MLLYSVVSSPSDRSTLHSLADLFIPIPNRQLREAFSHAAIAAITARILFPIARYSFIQLSELGRRGEKKKLETAAKVIRTEASRLSLAFYRWVPPYVLQKLTFMASAKRYRGGALSISKICKKNTTFCNLRFQEHSRTHPSIKEHSKELS